MLLKERPSNRCKLVVSRNNFAAEQLLRGKLSENLNGIYVKLGLMKCLFCNQDGKSTSLPYVSTSFDTTIVLESYVILRNFESSYCKLNTCVFSSGCQHRLKIIFQFSIFKSECPMFLVFALCKVTRRKINETWYHSSE